jgi:formiminoglutamase
LRYDSSYNFEDDVELHGMKVGDLGDVDVSSTDTNATLDRVTEAMKTLFEANCHPLMVGGDNSVTFAGVRALAQSGVKKIGVLSLDAHLDVRPPNPDILSGSPNYLILEKVPEVNPKNLAVVGLRRFANSKTYRDWALKKGMRLYPMKEIRRRGFQGMIESAVQAATDGVEALYVSVDMDVVDQAWAPGVSSPSPDGLTPREVFDAVQLASSQKSARAFDVVETAPNLDPTGNTARVAAISLLQYLVGRFKPPTMSKPGGTREQGPRSESAARERPMSRGPPRSGGYGGGSRGGGGGFGRGGGGGFGRGPRF